MEWLLLYVVTTMPEFDAYLMVDWSASSRPVTGKDSVWYCLVVRSGDSLSLAAHENPSTRHRAMAEIGDILRGLAHKKRWCSPASIFRTGTRPDLPRAGSNRDSPVARDLA